MILKASERGGGKQLALHLLNVEDNEHCEIHDLRGFVSDDLVSAMKEVYAVSKGTKCKNFLFSISLNPPQNESVGVDIFEGALRRIEEKMGLSAQPRAVVFHEKEGRRHCHAVYSKIDTDEMKAINLSFFKTKLRNISRELYFENDWQMPRGLMDSEARDPRNYSLEEYQQAKRMGENPRDLKAMLQECWAVSDNRTAFEHAIAERGLVLARGDRRGHVAVTHDGEVLSVARYIGKKAKEVREKLGEPDQTLPSVDDAQHQMAQDMTAAFNRHAEEAKDLYDERKQELEDRRQEMTEDHRDERRKLDIGQQQRFEEENRLRSEQLNTGLRGLWDKLTGRHTRIQQENVQEALESLRRDREQRDTLVQAHLEDRRALQTEIVQERSQQAELLHDLHQDSKPYREAYAKAVGIPEPFMQDGVPESALIADTCEKLPPEPASHPIETLEAEPVVIEEEARVQSPPEPEPIETADPVDLTDQFQYHAQPEPVSTPPTPEDRLQAMRDNQAPIVHNNGPEHER